MAKGLFAVYRDDQAVPGPSAALVRPLAHPANKATSRRRKDGASARLDGASGLRVPRFGEKENVDPLGPGVRGLGAGKLAKKPSALVAKRVDSCAPAAAVTACGGVRAPSRDEQRVKGAATNAVCTGTLRTRVLPDLPPLEPVEPAAPLAPAPPPAQAAPHVADIVLAADDKANASASPRTSLDARSALSASTGSSARDSGYAHSVDSRACDTSLDMDIAAAFADEEEQEAVRQVDGREADRRARALTESPLAEITQAFTGLGGFSAANMASPTPRPHAARPAPPTRTRSSPSKASSTSALPTRMAPYAYSTTATTKRARPKPTTSAAGDKPRAAAGGPMRF
ncbi:uncharacterized protein RHOBADRAFT_43924 [Rhodotorula graminis WP1]|uniref:Uncharacterized protein n=1 Tax=Rhodotorula graminis (strain WP1) TaxID=578459 RepID=A0A194S4H5_RHOGW|nr:uncharacterized protein RHOBADRAFT_43924 [Rhodotorula graminis WP1]KPV75419.1 hypothetical protein RHOBADRAFT_43924 [Rhodotorula graminis WP1]